MLHFIHRTDSAYRVAALLSALGVFVACSSSEPDDGADNGGSGSAAASGGVADCVDGTCTTGEDTGSGGGGATPGAGGEGNSAGGGTLGGSGGALGTGGGVATGGDAATGGQPATGGDAGSGGIVGSGGSAPGEWPFLIGADVTHTMQDEYWGATYTDGGVQKPLEVILKDHGFNAARIDTFVDPTAPGGFAEGEPEAFRGLAQTITLAKRIKAQGMYFLLDFHMSDTWTNPGAQNPPNAWANLSFSDMQNAVSTYISDAVTQLVNAGARPDIVQVGNEITNGMLWDSGRISNDNFANFAGLLKAGIAAVKSVDENIVIMLHIEKCNNLSTTRWWLDGVLGQGVQFDVFGQSCYAPTESHAGYQGMPSEWQTMFTAIASEYPDLKFAIAEYSAEQRGANDVIFDLPDKRGIGTFNWDPMRFYDTHPNDALFSTGSSWSDYIVIPEKMSIYDQIAADYAAAGR